MHKIHQNFLNPLDYVIHYIPSSRYAVRQGNTSLHHYGVSGGGGGWEAGGGLNHS